MTVTAVAPATVGSSRTDAIIVKITGEIGLGTMVDDGHTGVAGDTLLDSVLKADITPLPKLVVFDLTEATYLSSLGIGALLRCKTRADAAGSEVRMAISGPLVTLMRFGRLEKLFKIVPDVKSALE